MRVTQAEINLHSLKHNVDGIRKRMGQHVKIMGVVKASAYGHGSEKVAEALVQFGCDYLGVAFLEEAVELREHGVKAPMLVFGSVHGNQLGHYIDYHLDLTVSSIDDGDRVNAIARSKERKAAVHLKIDTGMERIGVRAETAMPFIEYVCSLPYLEVVGVYSHLATADERDKSFAHEQLERFDLLLKNLQKKGIEIPLKHVANSAAILDLPESYYSMVRPGIMLYGYYPSHETTESIPLQPVLTLRSQVIYMKEVDEGTSISYGRKYFTRKKTRIATIPIGYADGYSRRLTNQTEVLIHGNRFPVVGTICMDLLMVDIGMESNVTIGDEVVLIGKQGNETTSAWGIANKLGTIPYEVLTGISSRVPRVYI